MSGERQTVCLHACSVCVCRTLCSRLKGFPSIWSWCSSRDFQHLILSLFSCLFLVPCSTLSSLNCSGKGLNAKAVVLSTLIWTAIYKRWLVRFVGTSCVVRQHRSFFQHVQRWFGARFNFQRWCMFKLSGLKFNRADDRQLRWYEATRLDEVCRIELTASLCLKLLRKFSCMWWGYSWCSCSWSCVDHRLRSTFRRAQFHC